MRVRDINRKSMWSVDVTPLTVATIALKIRQRRAQYVSSSLFSEPVWDAMLDMFIDQDPRVERTADHLAETAGIGVSTMQRWLGIMADEGLIERIVGPIETYGLTAQGQFIMNRIFDLSSE
jgi:predicted transcriptional regulator